ncbi:hypothetical protein QE152_g18006 [Popillia japonica]|uniref:Uncharacterized protein n=1 Tax=Popillia japonica TaxID=7064 RepID=A0AAW1L150_POPJA
MEYIRILEDVLLHIRILEDVLLPSVRVVYPPPHRITLVEDNLAVHNLAVHTAAAVREWFQQDQEDIEVLPWPTKSPTKKISKFYRGQRSRRT